MIFINFKIVIRICIFTIFLTPVIQGISLDNTGSYKLVVAIDERTVQNSVSDYVENIKKGIQDLSDVLHSSTNSKFSIQEVDIVVPSHWSTPFDSVATTQYYMAADVKISHVHNHPFVDNSNSCGHPGSAILLPYNFFNDSDTSIFGSIGKALLTQFVRFRFGAWEELGYPGGTVFPYFWKPLSGHDWEINVCANAPISGNFTNIVDGKDCSPTTEDEYPPPSECRFFPSPQQTAQSSIMGYHYLPTIEKFCNGSTHNRKQPTAQNFFCKYKSITEIIESSSDWKGVTQPNTPNSVVFKVVKTSALPLLYILLDAGISQAPSVVLSEISSTLKTFVEDSALGNVVAAVGKYPADNKDELLTEIVPWTPFKEGQEQFFDAFENTFGRVSGFRDFGGALKEATRIVRERHHSKGAVILMVKTGIETKTADLTSESDVLTQVTPSKLKIFAVEIQGSEIQPTIALARVCSKSEGIHLILRSISNITLELDDFLLGSLKNEMQHEIEITRNFILGMLEIIPVNTRVELRATSTIQDFDAYLFPLKGRITTPAFRAVSGGDGNTATANFLEMQQWGSNLASNAAKIYYHNPNSKPNRNPIVWDVFDYACAEDDCQVLVQIFIKVADLNTVPKLTLTVSTSAENSVVDMAVENSASDLGTPFAVYAKLQQDNIPLQASQGLDVFAYVVQTENSEVYKIELMDDGRAVPDVSTNDGIFSGTFVPISNGHHNIFVSVKYRKPQTQRTTKLSSLSQSVGKLFPVDQIDIGCGSGCWSDKPTVEFVISETLSKLVEFKNVDKYIPMAHRIGDFSVTPLSQYQIRLEWTDPGVIMADGLIKIDSFEIKYSDDFDKLLMNIENTDDLFSPDQIPLPGEPGNQQSVTFDFEQEADLYFAIRGITSLSGSNAPAPVISVISGANVRSTVIPTTTTTTTTTIRPTTTSTAAPTTSDPGTGSTSSNTTDDGITNGTTILTSKRTTTRRPTTPTSTKAPTTTPRPTPSPFPSSTEPPPKHWFETTEGIITISVFGGGMVLLFSLGIFIVFRLRSR